MGAHACRQRSPPANLRWSDAEMLLDTVAERETYLLPRSVARRKLTIIESRPIFEQLLLMVEDSKLTNRPSFRHYSAHDITLVPVLNFFRIYDGIIPHYRARIIVEIYKRRHSQGGELFFRLLYNGRSVTQAVPFCPKTALCPFSTLIEQLNMVAFREFHVNTLKELCQNV